MAETRSTPPLALLGAGGLLLALAVGALLFFRSSPDPGDGETALNPAEPLDEGDDSYGGDSPDDAQAACQRGILLGRAGRFEDAIKEFELAIELDPELIDGYLNRCIARKNMNDSHGAVTDATQVIELDPSYALAYSYRGSAHQQLGDLEAAIADFSEAIRLDPEDPISHGNRALARMNQGDLLGAIEDGDRAIELGHPRAVTIQSAMDEVRLRVAASQGIRDD